MILNLITLGNSVCEIVEPHILTSITWWLEIKRKKERQAPEANEKMKNELPQVGFEPTCTCMCAYMYI